jgi:hypothetical protein
MTDQELNNLHLFMLDYARAHKSQRRGQAYFNALAEQQPEMADRIRGTPDDPFYDDERIEPFFNRIEKEISSSS